MIPYLLTILILGVLLALLKPYVEPALFTVALVITVLMFVFWLLRAANLFTGVPMPRLFSLDTHTPTSLSSGISNFLHYRFLT